MAIENRNTQDCSGGAVRRSPCCLSPEYHVLVKEELAFIFAMVGVSVENFGKSEIRMAKQFGNKN